MSDDAKMWQEAHARAVAEIARLRSVCRRCSGVLMRQYDKMTLEQVQQLPWLSAAIVNVAQDIGACGDGAAGKEPSDGL